MGGDLGEGHRLAGAAPAATSLCLVLSASSIAIKPSNSSALMNRRDKEIVSHCRKALCGKHVLCGDPFVRLDRKPIRWFRGNVLKENPFPKISTALNWLKHRSMPA